MNTKRRKSSGPALQNEFPSADTESPIKKTVADDNIALIIELQTEVAHHYALLYDRLKYYTSPQRIS